MHMWEGSARIDLIRGFVEWADELCTSEAACDDVCCCRVEAGSFAQMLPVSEDHPIAECNHYVAGVALGANIPQSEAHLEGFYCNLGIALIGAVMDGDCGIDTMCQMVGLPLTFEQRVAIRQ